MDKKLENYIKEIEKASKNPTKELIEYHKTMVQQFQHERLVHLIVTFFFALFLIIFFFAFIVASICLSGEAGFWITTSIGIMLLMFFVTTLLYIRHYYQLENGTQKLEHITKKLYGRGE